MGKRQLEICTRQWCGTHGAVGQAGGGVANVQGVVGEEELELIVVDVFGNYYYVDLANIGSI